MKRRLQVTVSAVLGVALIALLCVQLPGSTRALWGDHTVTSVLLGEGGTFTGTANIGAPESSGVPVSVGFMSSNGESVSGPSSVTIPANQTSVQFDVDYGPMQSDASYIDMTVTDGTEIDTDRLYYPSLE